MTAGIISARNRDINSGPYDDFLQTDASINRGNSGGPMFNLDGQVIGVNTAIFSPSGGSIGIGFAIPSNIAGPIVRQLIDTGEVKRGWIGVRIQEVTPEIADTLGLDKASGALVASVIGEGPAEAAGIRTGDVILEFAGRPVEEMRSLPRIVADTDVGQTVPVKVWRDGKEQTVEGQGRGARRRRGETGRGRGNGREAGGREERSRAWAFRSRASTTRRASAIEISPETRAWW